MIEQNTRTAVDRLQEEVKAQLRQNHTDLEQQQEETKQTMGKVAADLEELARQLNTFKPTSANVMGGFQEKFSKEVTQQMSVSEQRIELMSPSVEEQNKSVTDTNGLLKDLMIGIENLGDNTRRK